MSAKYLIATLMAAAACACTPLTAKAPLFSVEDQTGPAPLTEGTWAVLGDHCSRAEAARRTPPHECQLFQVHRATDGAWMLRASGNDEHGVHHELNLRFVLAPAVHTQSNEAYAPLYVAEYLGSADETPDASDPHVNDPHYAVLAPIGTMPAHELIFVPQIDCSAILREGPIEGIEETQDANGHSTSCVAEDRRAVRVAAQRALIEELSSVDGDRLVFVRP